MLCVFSPSAAHKSVQWQVKLEELRESRVCVSVLLRCPYLGLVKIKRNFRIAVFFMEMEFLVPGKPAPTGLWLLDSISAGDLCACPILAEAGQGLDSRLAQSRGQGWGLGSGLPQTPSARFSYSKRMLKNQRARWSLGSWVISLWWRHLSQK